MRKKRGWGGHTPQTFLFFFQIPVFGYQVPFSVVGHSIILLFLSDQKDEMNRVRLFGGGPWGGGLSVRSTNRVSIWFNRSQDHIHPDTLSAYGGVHSTGTLRVPWFPTTLSSYTTTHQTVPRRHLPNDLYGNWIRTDPRTLLPRLSHPL